VLSEVEAAVLGDACRMLRVSINATQREIAERLGVTRKTVERFEVGSRRSSRVLAVAIMATLRSMLRDRQA
jgi:DNA-binding XRE family transcriptional regulator